MLEANVINTTQSSFSKNIYRSEDDKFISRLDNPVRAFLAKRILDVMVSLLALLALSPLLMLVALAIKVDSRGPVLFSQVRWGKSGKKIRVFKFRSMRTDLCDASGIAQTTCGDSRVTRIGRVIRKTNIDELPQFINVLRGEMSLVGPRCHPIGMLAAGVPYEVLVHNYHERHYFKPGITGLAQIRGLRGPTVSSAKARARINADLHYIRNYSFWLDLKIIALTFASQIRGGTGF